MLLPQASTTLNMSLFSSPGELNHTGMYMSLMLSRSDAILGFVMCLTSYSPPLSPPSSQVTALWLEYPVVEYTEPTDDMIPATRSTLFLYFTFGNSSMSPNW